MKRLDGFFYSHKKLLPIVNADKHDTELGTRRKYTYRVNSPRYTGANNKANTRRFPNNIYPGVE